MPERRTCTACGESIIVRKDDQLRVHWITEETATVVETTTGAKPKVGDPCPGGALPQPKGIEDKARRYIAQGRVKVVGITPTERIVHVQGTQPEPYRVRILADAQICPCEAKTSRCAHVVAAMLVVDMPPRAADAEPDELDRLLAAPVERNITSDPDYDWGRFDGE